MEKNWFLCKPGLCLCLVLLLLLQSCALFKQAEDATAHKQQSTWQLVVRLAPGYDYSDFTVLPGCMKIVITRHEFIGLKSTYEEISCNGSLEQIQHLHEALKMSGMVIKMDIQKLD